MRGVVIYGDDDVENEKNKVRRHIKQLEEIGILEEFNPDRFRWKTYNEKNRQQDQPKPQEGPQGQNNPGVPIAPPIIVVPRIPIMPR